jgi:hypothetical protein
MDVDVFARCDVLHADVSIAIEIRVCTDVQVVMVIVVHGRYERETGWTTASGFTECQRSGHCELGKHGDQKKRENQNLQHVYLRVSGLSDILALW